jgi:hypothetical protein|tara:strand:+ start:880 stop:1074 length:195 start_codon:yes stop_codon:yes gene_type:complete
MSEVFRNKDGEIVQRTKCEIYTRVMGYHRPVTSFNTGKKAEFYSRNYFKTDKTENASFNEEFSS